MLLKKKKISTMNDFKKAIAADAVVLVEFYASWCPHCQRMMPVVDEVKKQLAGKAAVLQYDIDKYSALADSQGIETVPTFIVYKEGKEAWRGSGEMTADQLAAHVAKA